nr:MAG TPA: hypothetical protein [Caudoviricetes sp.]
MGMRIGAIFTKIGMEGAVENVCCKKRKNW